MPDIFEQRGDSMARNALFKNDFEKPEETVAELALVFREQNPEADAKQIKSFEKGAIKAFNSLVRENFDLPDVSISVNNPVPQREEGEDFGSFQKRLLEFEDLEIESQRSDPKNFVRGKEREAALHGGVTQIIRKEANEGEDTFFERPVEAVQRFLESAGTATVGTFDLDGSKTAFVQRFMKTDPDFDGTLLGDLSSGLGSSAPSLAAGVGTALVSKNPAIGFTVGSAIFNAGTRAAEGYRTALSLTNDTDKALEGAFKGLPASAIDTFGDKLIPGIGKVGSKAIVPKSLKGFAGDWKNAKDSVARLDVIKKHRKPVAEHIAGSLRNGSKGFVSEGATELGGELAFALGIDSTVEGSDTFSETVKEAHRIFAIGGLIGGTLGAAGGIAETAGTGSLIKRAARANVPLDAVVDLETGVIRETSEEIVKKFEELKVLNDRAEAQFESESDLSAQELRLNTLSDSGSVSTPEQAQVAAIGDQIKPSVVPESSVSFDTAAIVKDIAESFQKIDAEKVDAEKVKDSKNGVDIPVTQNDNRTDDRNNTEPTGTNVQPAGVENQPVENQSTESTPSSSPEQQKLNADRIDGGDGDVNIDSDNSAGLTENVDTTTQAALTPRERVNRAFETSTDLSGGDATVQASNQISTGFKKAELVRALEGKPSQADIADEIKRSKTLSRGREVRTREGSGKVISTPFGKVKVELDNGETKTFERDQIAFKTLNEQEAVESIREKAEAEISSREERKGISDERNNTDVDPDSTTDLDSTDVSEEGGLKQNDSDDRSNDNVSSGRDDTLGTEDTTENPLVRQSESKKPTLSDIKTKDFGEVNGETSSVSSVPSVDTIQGVSVDLKKGSDLSRLVALVESFGAKVKFFRGPSQPSIYDVKNGIIYINVDSPRSAALLLSHEVAHWVQHNDPVTWGKLLETMGVKEGQTLDDLVANNENIDASKLEKFDTDFLEGQDGYTAEEKLHEFIAEVVAESLFDLTSFERFKESLPPSAADILYRSLAKAFKQFILKLREMMGESDGRRDALGVFGKDGMLSAIQDVERVLRVADRYGELRTENGINPEQYRRDIIHTAHRDTGSPLNEAEIDAKILLGEDISVDYNDELSRAEQVRNVKQIEEFADTLVQAKFPLARKEKLTVEETNQIFDQLHSDPNIVKELDDKLNTEDGGSLAIEALTSSMAKLFEKTERGEGKKLLMTRVITASFITGGLNPRRVRTGSGASKAGALLSFMAHSKIGHLTLVTRMISDSGLQAAEKILGVTASNKLAWMKENDSSTYNRAKRNAYKLWTMQSSTGIENALSKLEKLLESPTEVERSKESGNTAVSSRILKILKSRGNEDVTLDQVSIALIQLSGAHPDLQAEIEAAFDELTDIKAQERRLSFMFAYGEKFPQANTTFENASAAKKLEIVRKNITQMIEEGEPKTLSAMSRFSGRKKFDPSNKKHVEAVVQKSWQEYTKAVKRTLSKERKSLERQFKTSKVSINTITKALEKGILGDGSVDLHWNVIDAEGKGITFSEETVERLESLSEGIRKMASMGHQDAEAVAHMMNEMSNILQDQLDLHPKLSEAFKSTITSSIFGTLAGLSLAATSGASAFFVDVISEIVTSASTFNGARFASVIKNLYKGFLGQTLVKSVDTYMTGVDTTNGVERRFDTTLDRNDILNKADTQANSARRRWKQSVAAKNPITKLFRKTQAVMGFFQVFGVWRVFQGLDRISVDRSKGILNDARFIVRSQELKLSKREVEEIRQIAGAKAQAFRRLILDTMGDDVPDKRVNFMVSDMVTREVNLTLAKKAAGDLNIESNVPASSQIRQIRGELRVKLAESKSANQQANLKKQINKLTRQLKQVDSDERMLEASVGEAQASLGINDEVAGMFGLISDKVNNNVLGGLKRFGEDLEPTDTGRRFVEQLGQLEEQLETTTDPREVARINKKIESLEKKIKEGKFDRDDITKSVSAKTIGALWSITPTILGAIRTPAYAADRYATFIPIWGFVKYRRLASQKGVNPLAMDDFALNKRASEVFASNTIGLVGLILNVMNYLEEEEDRFLEITGAFPINDIGRQVEWDKKDFKPYSLHIHLPNLRRALGRLFGDEVEPTSGTWKAFGFGKGVFAPLVYPLIATDKITRFALDTPTVDKTQVDNLALGGFGVLKATTLDIFNASVPLVTAGTETWMSANESATRLSEGTQNGITGRWYGRMTGNMMGAVGGYVRSGQKILYGDKQYTDGEAFWYANPFGRIVKNDQMFAEKYDMFGRSDISRSVGSVLSRVDSPISWGGTDAQSVRDAKDLTKNQKKGFEMLLNTDFAPLATTSFKWATFAERNDGFGQLTESDWQSLMESNDFDSKQDAYESFMQTTSSRFFDHLVSEKKEHDVLKEDVVKHSNFLDAGSTFSRAKTRFLQTEVDQNEYAASRKRLKSFQTSLQNRAKKEWTSSTGFSSYRHLRKAVDAKDITEDQMNSLLPISIEYKKQEVLLKKKFGTKATVKKHNKSLWQDRKDAYETLGIKPE